MSSEASSFERTDDIENRMRRRLGLDAGSVPASVPSQPIDPLRGARQAIRSQAAAREYVERQLAHAEATIQDLRGKLHHTRRNKDAAIEAARSAAARKGIVERTLASTESALATEKAARDRGDRALREAQATINHLQAKLDAAAQGLETAKAELTAERQGRQKAEDAWRRPKTVMQIDAPATDDEPAALPMIVQRMCEAGCPVTASEAAGPQARPDEVDIQATRQPTRRSRKTESTPLVQASFKQARTVLPTLRAKELRRNSDKSEPVKWWIEGWRGQRT
jgi:hypothetical protein